MYQAMQLNAMQNQMAQLAPLSYQPPIARPLPIRSVHL